MKLSRLTLTSLLCFSACSAGADDYSSQQISSNTQTLVGYVLNLGGYLGYDLTQSPGANSQVSQKLISASTIQLAQNYVFNTFLGAIPVDAVSATLAQFIPTNMAGANIINSLANATFINQNYSSPMQTGQGTFSVSPLIDQPTYQQDPVSQAVLNILGTPDYSYCMSYGQVWDDKCSLLYQNKIMSNVIGTIPTTGQFFSYDYNQQFLSQLNSNSLTAPLLYSTETAQQSTGSAIPNQQAPGLTAQNQVQQAANFIRYASGAVTPPTLPKLKAYEDLYNLALPPSGSAGPASSTPQQMQAQAMLNSYFTNLRVYAAQSSVGLSNLYYILSKRLPQKQSSDNSIVTSQAMSEFNMATWRLFNTNNPSTPNKQWINQINGASSATVQKEIATLLAEINYQMYLDRQLQERILLTNTIMLIQNTRASQPTSDFSTQPAAAPGG